jgi:bacterioferritin-associated ferredoxin
LTRQKVGIKIATRKLAPGFGDHTMYVCNCNGLRESCVENAVACGARTAGAVYKAHGCNPQCGKCVPEMRQLVKELRSNGSSTLAGAAA